ncbi:uncharacterized protein [Solanum lycopersicum]|uniref:uncharacterized protein n=1 Tax=Solanum lycopersicum TaxID=4081 RepID=UPI00374783E5
MDPPQLQGGKSEDSHEFFTTCRELLEIVGLAELHGVRYATLQLVGPARECWRTYSRALPVKSPPVTWEKFSSAFHRRFIPWSVREECYLRFENLRQDLLYVTEYEARFCQLFRHALAIIPDETKRIRRFVRGLTFSIRSAVFRASREGASVQYIVSAAKEEELMERKELRDLKSARTSDHMMRHCTSQRGLGRPQPNSSFQTRPLKPLGRGHGRVQSGRGGRVSSSGVAAQQSGCRGTTQAGDGRGGHFYTFSGKPKEETFDADITSMSCLSPYHVVLDCNAKTLALAILGVPRVEWKGASGSYPSKVISFICAQRLVEKGYLPYLDFLQNTSFKTPHMDSVPMVQEFPNVFSYDLPGVPPDRDIDFALDLAPDTKPIYVPPYCMAPGASLFSKIKLRFGYHQLKIRVSDIPRQLFGLEEGVDFTVYCDASGFGLGGVLMQKGKVIAYASRH